MISLNLRLKESSLKTLFLVMSVCKYESEFEFGPIGKQYLVICIHFCALRHAEKKRLITMHTACISFWITKIHAISTDTSFEIKMLMKIYTIEIIFKSHEPFQSYLLSGQANSARKAGYFHRHFYLKTSVSRNCLSIGNSEWDTSSVNII